MSSGASWCDSSLRACNICLKLKINCVKRFIAVISGDCKTRDKSTHSKFDLEINCNGCNLAFVYILPDTPHVRKGLKTSVAN